MSKFNSSDRERLCGLLGQQLELFEQICGLCKEQTDLLDKGEVEKLEVSLGEVRELREKINGLHQESETLMQSYALSSVKKKDDGVEELSAKMKEKIELCAQLNVENMNKIKAMIADNSKKIDVQSSKRKGIGNYAQTITTTSERFDKKS